MRVLVSLVLIGLFSSSQCTLRHYTFFQSFPQALQECAEYLEVSNCSLQRYIGDSYPNCETVRNLIHCTLHSLKVFNETSLKHHAIVNFFEPAPEDTCYENRTAECVQNVLSTSQDLHSPGQAYDLFQCYYRQYGNIRDSKQLLSATTNELGELAAFVVKTANVPRCELIQYARGNILGQPNFPVFFYIAYYRSGLYSIQDGIHLDRFYTQFGGPELLTEQTRECVEAVDQEFCDSNHTTRLYKMFEKCLVNIIPTLSLVQNSLAQTIGTDLGDC